MESARPRGPRALVEVARILVQKRRENSATDHDVGKAVGVSGAIALTEALPTLGVVGVITGLLGGSGYTYSNEGYRIVGDLGGELEL